jgi:phosphatidylserine/phosphatidylglycerophosphate/cardiolipin synthase-like enzyme
MIPTEKKMNKIMLNKRNALFLVCTFFIQILQARPIVYFNGAIKNQLIRCIDSEQKYIKAALFTFTHNETAIALCQAIARGVEVELVLDQYTQQINSGCGFYMRRHNAKVWQYISSHPHENMHHKYWLFQSNNASLTGRLQNSNSHVAMETGLLNPTQNVYGHSNVSLTEGIQSSNPCSITVTGSFNPTENAHKHSQENAIFIEDQDIFLQYSKNFEQLKKNSLKITKKLAEKRDKK